MSKEFLTGAQRSAEIAQMSEFFDEFLFIHNN